MVFVPEIEVLPKAAIFQLWCVINEKDSVINVVFFAKFDKESVRNTVCSRRFKRCEQQFVCFGIDSSVQPVLLAIKSDRGLIDRKVIRLLRSCVAHC